MREADPVAHRAGLEHRYGSRNLMTSPMSLATALVVT
jgi:hypothetical protein